MTAILFVFLTGMLSKIMPPFAVLALINFLKCLDHIISSV